MFIQQSYGIYDFETKYFLIRYEAIEESSEFHTEGMDEELANEILTKISSGELICFSSSLNVYWKETDELLGSSHIGGNVYESFEDFMDHYGLGYSSMLNKLKKEKDPVKIKSLKRDIKSFKKHGSTPYGSYFKELVNEAIESAKTTEIYQNYKTTFQTKRRVKIF